MSSLLKAVDKIGPILEKLAEKRMSSLPTDKKITPSISDSPTSSSTPSSPEEQVIDRFAPVPAQVTKMAPALQRYTMALPLPGSPGSVFFEGEE